MMQLFITDVVASPNNVELRFNCDDFIYAWLENKNKHIPEIFEIEVDNKNKVMRIDSHVIERMKNECRYDAFFKLSISTEYEKVYYQVNKKNGQLNFPLYTISLENYEIYFEKIGGKISSKGCVTHCKLEKIKNHNCFKPIQSARPVNLAVIGTCFTRSIFKNDEYFNPGYGKYFNVVYTAFHDSFISLMSNRVEFLNYGRYKDLQSSEVLRYIPIEFEKNIECRLKGVDFIFIDNYMDATTPVIRIGDNQYLTYNKYFSESIVKRIFSKYSAIYPGSDPFNSLYRNSIKKLKEKLLACGLIDKIILLGGRLCKSKIDLESNLVTPWTEKMSWISESNQNWDIVDEIFLEEIPETTYLDMRNSKWLSDIKNPLVGGASPSHYQSEFYKEIFEKLKTIVIEGARKND